MHDVANLRGPVRAVFLIQIGLYEIKPSESGSSLEVPSSDFVLTNIGIKNFQMFRSLVADSRSSARVR